MYYYYIFLSFNLISEGNITKEKLVKVNFNLGNYKDNWTTSTQSYFSPLVILK
jgi:hypothetical protein